MENNWKTPVEFENFFRKQHPLLVLYASKILNDLEIARDIVQEVFLRTWENRDKIDINTTPETYLFRAVRNQCLNYLKHKSVEQKYTDATEKELKQIESDFYTNVDEDILKLYTQETSEIIKKTVDSLPEKCRKIFEMSRYKGLKNSEIASQLNISLRTVETQIYRALKELKKKLKK
jgi:RNA polymerase sigma-70 factor (ECF subfamily)